MRVVIYGSRPDGHAKVVLEGVQELGMECVGFVDDFPENRSREWRGLGVLGGRGDLPQIADTAADAVAFGFADGGARADLVPDIEAAGLALPVLIWPSASVSPSADIGPGSQILSGVRIGPDVRIGPAVLVNSATTVGHDSQLGAGVTLGPGTMICGRVWIGDGATAGAAVTAIPDVRIGARAMVGAGAAVVSDVAEDDLVVGVPARSVGPRA